MERHREGVVRISISGVQPKHSLRMGEAGLELCESNGRFLLKPSVPGNFVRMDQMPANEHATMRIATEVFGIPVAACAVLRFPDDGSMAYLTRRFDIQADGSRLPMEDFAQIIGTSEATAGPAYKYSGSYEEIAGHIRRHASAYAVEAESFFHLVVYNYLVHNGDAHLKNFSMRHDPVLGIHRLAPGYDLLNTRLHLPNESAMPASNRVTLPNGRKIFVSGMNMAWINFAADVGDAPLDSNKFREAVEDIRDAGGNTMRVWLSTNGSNDPKFDTTTGLVSGLGTKTISNVKSMLAIANRNGVVLALDLLTHNLMAAKQVGDWNHMSIDNNKKLMRTDAGLKAYIDKAVVPLVKAIGNDSAILCWEVFNEPEGMVAGESWELEPGVTMTDVQRVVNRVAGAIHRAVPGILVSNGAVTFETSTDVDGMQNYYSDAALKAVGEDADGFLDFYMVHYYGWNGVKNSPFTKNNAHWKLDKPLVIGEFPANSWSPTVSSKNKDAAKIDTLFTYLYQAGYAGGLSWCYFGDGQSWLGDYKTSAPAIKAVYTLDSASIKIKDVTRTPKTGNGVLAVSIDNDKATVYPALKLVTPKDFSKGTNFSFDLLVPKASAGGIKVTSVFQTNDYKTWNTSGVYCTLKSDSVWSTCTAPFSGFNTASEMNVISSIMFQFIANPTFHGQVWFDNIRVDTDTIWNFNDGKVAFGPDTYDPVQAEKITGMNVIYPNASASVRSRSFAASAALSLRSVANGFEWVRSEPLSSAATVRVIDLQGHELYRTVAKAGSATGFVPSVGTGLRFVVVESAQARDVRTLTSTR